MATSPAGGAEDGPKVEGRGEEHANDTTDEISTSLDEVTATVNLRNSRTRSFQESLRHQIDSLRTRLNRRRSNSSSSAGSGNDLVRQQVASRLDVVSSAVMNRAPVAVIEARRPHLSPTSASIFRVETSSSAGVPTANANTPDDPIPAEAEGRITESQQRRSSVLFASRTQASRLLVDGGSSRVLLASGGHGNTTSRRDLLGSTCLGQEVKLHDIELHRPSNATPTDDSATDSSEIIEYDSLEDDVKDVGAEFHAGPEAEDKGNILYSWGRGITSLHDDDVDRISAAQVESKLKSKALLSISTNQYHSACATSTGSVYVVGQNVDGCVDPSIRDGAVVSRPIFLESLNDIRVIQVSCGYDHTAGASSLHNKLRSLSRLTYCSCIIERVCTELGQ